MLKIVFYQGSLISPYLMRDYGFTAVLQSNNKSGWFKDGLNVDYSESYQMVYV